MTISRVILASALVSLGSGAVAQSSFPTSDGVSRAPSFTLHCLGVNGVAAPCGTGSAPLVVTGGTSGTGLATASNQTSQLQAEQAFAAALGSQSDASYTTGPGSAVSWLKGMIAALAGGVTATPVNGIPTSRSLSLVAGQSTMLFPINAGRHYLAFQAPSGVSLWVNFVGGVALPNCGDCVQITSGTLYESGQYVTRGAVSVYAPVSSAVAAWEG